MTDTTSPSFPSSTGQPVPRRDGVAKVTGAAVFAADHVPADVLHAVYVPATIACGVVTGFDTEAAMAHPGVIEVFTPDNTPPLPGDPSAKPFPYSIRIEVLQDPRVRYANQPIALVLGETLEAATEGARLLAPTYDTGHARVGLDAGEPFEIDGPGAFGLPGEVVHGDVDAGHAAAVQSVDLTFETPAQYHNALETHAVVAEWNGDRVTLDVPSQAIALCRYYYGYYLGIPAENITVRSPAIGGGFGSKAMIYGPQIMAIHAARLLDRPVKLVLRRDQMFGPVGHREATRQRLRIGIDDDARMTVLDHEAVALTSIHDDFVESAANASHGIYNAGALRSAHRGVRANVGTPGTMRAPGHASGSAALECAIDEMAHEAGLDPLEFRLRNYADVEPGTGRPYSSKALRECYARGAERFGWSSRPLAPRQMTDEAGVLVGWGMGTALHDTPMSSAEARALIGSDGSARVEIAAADMGQGAWTGLAQIAADSLGLPLDRVDFHLGDSTLPDGGIAGGSGQTATAGNALHAAGQNAVAQLAELAMSDRESPLHGASREEIVAHDGRLWIADDDRRSDGFDEIMFRHGRVEIEGTGNASRSPRASKAYSMYAHGAVFAEVRVDPELFQARVTRLVGAFAAGRIVNPKLAESQLMGGMIWGLSFALHEEAKTDQRTGRIMNSDLAGYHVPVNADVLGLEVLTVHEDDPHVNPLGIKGVGELGITGTVGAIANAIWHATGTRTRRFPIRIEDLLAGAE